MKYLFTILATLISYCGFSQYYLFEKFESPNDGFRANFYIDTVNCSNNLWQIGRPQKTVFDTAYSAPNAIVTDTLNTYPANDTSIFYLYTTGSYYGMLSVSFYYQLDIDTMSTALVEISGDNGLNWINPMTEDATYMFYWAGGKPRLDTSTNGWRLFSVNLDIWSYSYPGSGYSFPHYRTSDSIIYRFTFISGDSLMHQDGWMMDDFRVLNAIGVGIEKASRFSAQISPNPSHGTISLHPNFTTRSDDRIVVYNMQGQQVYATNYNSGGPINLPLPDGTYTVKYYGAAGVATDRLVIIR
jgi:hypothetical protein